MSVLTDSLKTLQQHALAHDRVLVFYSGGKDSLATLSLVCQVWSARSVVAVTLYYAPGLAVVQERIDFARDRFGVEVLLIPSWSLGKHLKYGLYCVPVPSMPETTLPMSLDYARSLSGIDLVAFGGKKADGLWRKRQMAASAADNLVYPIARWNKWDVLGYLKSQNIPAPEKFDINTSASTLLWLYDHHREDFHRMEALFPFIGAVVKRREWYGIAHTRKCWGKIHRGKKEA